MITRRYHLLDIQGRDQESNYKQELVAWAREAIREGDRVLEIGAGFGVTTIWAAREVGDSGNVLAYEAGSQQIEVLEEAVRMNSDVLDRDLASRVEIKHAVVGKDIEVYGPMEGAGQIDPENLPSCDVVIMDCEGAETDILRHCEITPRVFIVESHPMFGAPSEDSESTLQSLGYDVRKIRKGMKEEGVKHILIAER